MLTRESRAAADSLGAQPDDIAAQIQRLRTYALPQLLFRVPYAHPPQDPEDRDPEARPLDHEGRSLAHTIKERLAKAWKWQWAELIAEMLADEEAAARQPVRLPPEARPHDKVGDPIHPRRLGAAANRGRHGGMRAARDNFMG